MRGIEQAKQRGLAGAVGAEQTHPVAGAEAPGLIAQDVGGADGRGERHVFDVVHLLAQARCRELLQREPIAGRRLIGDQGVRGVDAELGLAGARGSPASQPGELLAQEILTTVLGCG